jgi:cobalt-zinc-cadmium efflux system protein
MSLWLAQKKSNPVFTYGFKKTTVLAALANAVILLIAVGILGYESVTRLLVQQKVVEGNLIAWVAGLGIIINAVSAFLFYRQQKDELNARSAYLHLMTDALVSVGVVVSGVIISYTHWYWLDPAVGLVVMIVILISTWSLLKDSFKMSIDAVPSGIELSNIKLVIAQVKDVTSVHHIHVWALSTTENALTAHVTINEALGFTEKLAVIQHVKHELLHCNIQHSTIELESGQT